ncbi:glycosyl transferase [Roseovarius sp. A46]|uniref:glycosyltransferase family 4 protein n=1 Tax=Roseovarius sp. A46 TaxID=2109331 RepID=UPI00101377DE|nr:glycosyltransferase family 4 protein [Roseovarius sp. A46]RXV58632.1 glycosyl transferase [Roseovarius sp. A46]
MRIVVVNNHVPFIKGGAELHARNLRLALEEHGHNAVEVALPFKWYPATTFVDSIMAAKLTDLSESNGTRTDMMIGLRFPAYLAHHPNKVFWVLHQHRAAYDLWDSGHSDLLNLPNGSALRELVREEDKSAFRQTPASVFANSRNVAQRLEKYTQQMARPLYHPPPNYDLFQQGAFGDYLFAPSRLTPMKRQDMILDALALTRDPVRVVFSGAPDTQSHLDHLLDKTRALGLENRVTWLGEISDEDLVKTYAQARAVIFTPMDEDYGYITLEAMLSGKPVITVSDSGGPLEFITHRKEGLVCAPDPGKLARQFDKVMQDQALAERMGAAAYKKYHSLDISWTHVVETLTGSSAGN